MVGDARQECGEVPGVPGAGDTELLGDMRDAKIGRESLLSGICNFSRLTF